MSNSGSILKGRSQIEDRAAGYDDAMRDFSVPGEIYLQCGDEASDLDVTWSRYPCQPTDIAYIRRATFTALLEECDHLHQKIDDLVAAKLQLELRLESALKDS